MRVAVLLDPAAVGDVRAFEQAMQAKPDGLEAVDHAS